MMMMIDPDICFLGRLMIEFSNFVCDAFDEVLPDAMAGCCVV